MSIATTQQLKDYGFKAEQFGSPADFDVYLQDILTAAATWASPEVGSSVYSAAESAGSGTNWEAIGKAEKYKAIAELWRRRAAFIDGSATQAEGDPTPVLIARYEKSAKDYEDLARQQLARVSGDDPTSGSGVAIGHVQTGPFTEAEA